MLFTLTCGISGKSSHKMITEHDSWYIHVDMLV